MGEYTLDIPEVQVLVNFPLDGTASIGTIESCFTASLEELGWH